MLLFVVGIPAALIGIRESAASACIRRSHRTIDFRSEVSAAGREHPGAESANCREAAFCCADFFEPDQGCLNCRQNTKSKRAGPSSTAPPSFGPIHDGGCAASAAACRQRGGGTSGRQSGGHGFTRAEIRRGAERVRIQGGRRRSPTRHSSRDCRPRSAPTTDARVMALIAFPLRVNTTSGSRLYGAPSALRDYDRIFTPKVRRAILNSSARQNLRPRHRCNGRQRRSLVPRELP